MVASVWFQFLPLVQSFLSPLKAGGEGGYIYIKSHFYYSTGIDFFFKALATLPLFVLSLNYKNKLTKALFFFNWVLDQLPMINKNLQTRINNIFLTK